MDRLISRRTMFAGAGKYIRFADKEVERICIANWSSDGKGLTYDDAARVTSQQFRGKFAGNTSIVSFDEFQYFTGVDALFDEDGFYNCTSLSTIKLPSTLRTIGWGCFANCSALAGTFVIPASVTAISRSALMNTVGLTNLINLMPNTSDFFVGNSSQESGNGTGVLYAKNFLSSQRYTTAHYKHILIDGNLTFTSIDWLFQGGEVKCIRINGDFSVTSSSAVLYRDITRPVEFVELIGRQQTADSLMSHHESLKSGAVLHLGYNGIASTPEKVNVGEFTTIYIGSGESQAADQAVLDQYLADPDWAQYASKLDLWFNYSGEYKATPIINQN